MWDWSCRGALGFISPCLLFPAVSLPLSLSLLLFYFLPVSSVWLSTLHYVIPLINFSVPYTFWLLLLHHSSLCTHLLIFFLLACLMVCFQFWLMDNRNRCCISYMQQMIQSDCHRAAAEFISKHLSRICLIDEFIVLKMWDNFHSWIRKWLAFPKKP